jgi:hypothetical protein
MRLCTECRFFLPDNICNREIILDVESPKSLPSISPVDGKVVPFISKKSALNAMTFRVNGNCGMDAKLFEPKK